MSFFHCWWSARLSLLFTYFATRFPLENRFPPGDIPGPMMQPSQQRSSRCFSRMNPSSNSRIASLNWSLPSATITLSSWIWPWIFVVCSNPLVTGKMAPFPDNGPSNGVGIILEGVIFFSWNISLSSRNVRTSSTSVDSAFLAKQGPIKTTFRSSPYFFFMIRLIATMGETMRAR